MLAIGNTKLSTLLVILKDFNLGVERDGHIIIQSGECGYKNAKCILEALGNEI